VGVGVLLLVVHELEEAPLGTNLVDRRWQDMEVRCWDSEGHYLLNERTADTADSSSVTVVGVFYQRPFVRVRFGAPELPSEP